MFNEQSEEQSLILPLCGQWFSTWTLCVKVDFMQCPSHRLSLNHQFPQKNPCPKSDTLAPHLSVLSMQGCVNSELWFFLRAAAVSSVTSSPIFKCYDVVSYLFMQFKYHIKLCCVKQSQGKKLKLLSFPLFLSAVLCPRQLESGLRSCSSRGNSTRLSSVSGSRSCSPRLRFSTRYACVSIYLFLSSEVLVIYTSRGNQAPIKHMRHMDCVCS